MTELTVLKSPKRSKKDKNKNDPYMLHIFDKRSKMGSRRPLCCDLQHVIHALNLKWEDFKF